MKYITYKLKNYILDNKFIVLGIFFIVLLIVSAAIPTLSKYRNINTTYTITTWDGTVASSYSNGEGTKENPYIISNGSELAFFAKQLKTTNYEGEYFILSNDIVLNDGIFSYTKDNGIKYINENIATSEENNSFKSFYNLNGFKGTFDGGHHTIYGLYIDDAIDEQNALFTNLEGNVNNLYLKNSIIYGGKYVAGIASKANNSSLVNVSYDGFVISDESLLEKEINVGVNDIEQNVVSNEVNDYINVLGLDYIPGIVTEITLSGLLEIDKDNTLVKINGEIVSPGEFTISLDNKLKTSIPINYQSSSETTIKLRNLNYQIKYMYGNAAGIVSIAENIELKNVINKANVYGSVYASGIVNTLNGNSSLRNAYNVGKIESSHTSSGLISNINQNAKDIAITNCYHNGILISNNNAMIGNIENNGGSITLANIFNTVDEFSINYIDESNVIISNSYVISDKKINIGTSSGEFTKTTIEQLKEKSFIKSYLKYEEYINKEVPEDDVWVWSFENDTLPILYIDELNRPIANIYINEHSWEDYNNEFEILKFSDKLVFGIDEVNPLNSIKEVYYYISNEKEALTKIEINQITNWQKFEDIVELNEEGFYVIYAKIIDNNNNEYYLNTDLLVIDLTGSDIIISTNYSNDVWQEFKVSPKNYYIDKKISVTVNAEDLLSGINKVYYYISDKILSKDDVEEIEEWQEYTKEIDITNEKSIVYVKVLDNCNYSTYANTDLFILNGYILKNIYPGMNGASTENIYITDNSSVSLNYTYKDTNEYLEDSKHQLISNVILPENTKITLIDKIKNKTYVYVTSYGDYGYNDCVDEECRAKYDFELFNEVGSTNKFNEDDYSGKIDEEFIVIVDFKNAQILKNINNVTMSLMLVNDNINETRKTLVDYLKSYNVIYENNQSTFTLTTSFKDTINYSENSNYLIDFSIKMNKSQINDNEIYDTTYEDKNLGLAIKMINKDGNIVSKQNLKNISFKLNDKKYSPSSDGIVRINLEKGVKDIVDNLTIQTYSDNSSLEKGDYKFVINLYASYDGINSSENLSSIEIPAYVGENIYKNDNSFNVIMNNEDKIITTDENEFDFDFLVGSVSENTNIKMSLYKKESLSAYEQSYTIIDLGEYLLDENIEKYKQDIYYALKNANENNSLKINLNTGMLEKRGYMFIFELYEDDKIVNKVSKKFIVK